MITLTSIRLCAIDDTGLYMIIDWYEKVEGQPLTCIIQINQEELEEKGIRK